MSTNTTSGQTVKSPRRGKYDWLLLSIKLTGFNSPSGSKINIQLSKNQHFNYTSFGGRCIGYLFKNGGSSMYCPCVFWMKTRRTSFYSIEPQNHNRTQPCHPTQYLDCCTLVFEIKEPLQQVRWMWEDFFILGLSHTT